jgi:peptidoglycan/xylan/chitin deacetylase (PgdA/CDA1 family)
VYGLPTSQKVVAITIDAGSDLGYTNEILDTLSDKGVRVTFGITGEWADEHPAAVDRMADEGHQVMNHSYSHRSFTGASAANPLLTTSARQADLAKAEATLKALTGRTTKPFFRPPYGDSDASVLADVGAVGYAYTVLWTVDSGGWKGLSASEIITRVLDRTEPGAIIVFHVGSASKDVDAIGPIIDEPRDRGYSFVTLAGAYGI